MPPDVTIPGSPSLESVLRDTFSSLSLLLKAYVPERYAPLLWLCLCPCPGIQILSVIRAQSTPSAVCSPAWPALTFGLCIAAAGLWSSRCGLVCLLDWILCVCVSWSVSINYLFFNDSWLRTLFSQLYNEMKSLGSSAGWFDSLSWSCGRLEAPLWQEDPRGLTGLTPLLRRWEQLGAGWPLSRWCLILRASPSGYAGLPYSVKLKSKREHFKKPHSASTNLLASCVLISHWLRSHTTNPESIWEKTSGGCN